MQIHRYNHFVAVFLSVALHALLIVFAGNFLGRFISKPEAPKAEEEVVFLEVTPASPQKTLSTPPDPSPGPAPDPTPVSRIQAPQKTAVALPAVDRQPAFMDAPPAPTAQEWALAANYTLKNSKRYRYTWGQQVRSMMGRAIEGPDQGIVRFRIEIAPDGTLARLETLWTTSQVAENLARKAIENMPPLPPTPTGKTLIFEKTISFQPFDSDGPPLYKNDCLPDPPAFRNPFMWDGKSPQVRTVPVPSEKPDPAALEECLKQLPEDSIEAEGAHDKRQLEQWGSSKLGR
ncbi:energy transducer TonB [Rhodoferax sp. BAB1]|uniref:energy transducer TonB n=1 Tax=Rhodoferax sp. BAB1 TaxID=2741720 RepID=UPI0020C6B285|nr:energy transducer TonB [Rhodoferax sp. BAB1]